VDVYTLKSAADDRGRLREGFLEAWHAVQAGVFVPSLSFINCPLARIRGAGGVWRRPIALTPLPPGPAVSRDGTRDGLTYPFIASPLALFDIRITR